ncbi:polyphosphate--glucose phosphotransferase [Leucobacter ruminantium]|uniref:ROK family protein n=1 Tax=Leucobacter ruminantium TaxID=1289170 RepID=A0A939LWD5_9MICO|nr:ROK family protein [Leucobacter ruminantium]MBO1805999.1 ROK family protein [Leucobacter ruminantium]
MNRAFGLDIGGTGIKGAVVDLDTGELLSERIRIPTPQPSTVEAVLDTVERIVHQAGWEGPIGCTFPGIVKQGVIGSAANVDTSWIGVHLAERLTDRLDRPATVLNDADAAGLAEMRLGAGRGEPGVVLLLTLGTGIGSALFVDGRLVPNTELGHLELDGFRAERRAATSARERDELSFRVWAEERLQPYFSHVETLFSPDLFIVGGGVSRKAEKFLPLLSLRTRIIPAQLRSNSGIVGAALQSARA